MIHFALLLLALVGFACLCIANPRHQPALLGRALPARRSRSLRIGGWTMLALALILAWTAFGFGYGFVEAMGLASLGGLASVAALTHATGRRSRR